VKSNKEKRWLGKRFFATKGSQDTGMSLSLADRIIKDHNGGITVESEVGKGTTFTGSLPVWEEKT